ncbi:N-acetylmuramoyl-L-alanine amidase [Methylocapsa sp. S129]|uniref:N-acetylmuramoyl-L-alanine amidase n=1 Tax=Methylocapsa sp. S129 TaxID=1641869 RepID=UPI00131D7FFE|nr:N-acetylmuramoyl-L-alanine amidase [Methylocapsa sp. S129]
MDRGRVPDSPVAGEFIASPNHGERRGFGRPDCMIVHYTGMPTGAAALAWLCDPASELSSHYFVWEDGRVAQLVAEDRRAWHAGHSLWKGESDLNSASIGIEIVNPGHGPSPGADDPPPFPAVQIDAVIALLRDIGARHDIAPERVLAHSDIAPTRKIDPGEKFPWETLWRAGIGHWTPPAPIIDGAAYGRGQEGPPVRALQALLALYGYGVELTGVYDKQTQTIVAAFQRHFRPERVDGLADASTIATLRALIDGLPSRV